MKLQVGNFTTEVIDEGSGPPVVLCHGSASDRRTWRALSVALQAHGYRSVSYSRRHHWPNVPPTDQTSYRMATHVDDLVDLVENRPDGPAHLVGHSYGGFVALLVASRRPELVRSLTVIEPPVVPLFLSDPPRPAELIRVFRRKPKLGVALVKFAATGLVPATRAAKKNRMDEALRTLGRAILGADAFDRLDADRWAQCEANNIRAEYLSESLDPLSDHQVRSIDVPSLVVSGALSPPLWSMLADHLDELLPHSQRVEISSASHIVHEDNPGEFTDQLLAFLSSAA